MKSPLKDKPLRNPGESTQSRIYDLVMDGIFLYLMITGMFLMVALWDWTRYLSNSPINPWHYTVFTLLAASVTIYKIITILPKIRNMKLGRDGERVVGQYLDRLRENGARIFHDIPGDNFNLDHVVIASSGIYVIETKTYSKPDKGQATIYFDGERITLTGRGSFDAPVIQVRTGTNWLRQILLSSTGRNFPIRPVLLFPGWFVAPIAESGNNDLWVLNPKALPSFIARSQNKLNQEDMNLAAYHLSRYIRTCRDQD